MIIQFIIQVGATIVGILIVLGIGALLWKMLSREMVKSYEERRW